MQNPSIRVEAGDAEKTEFSDSPISGTAEQAPTVANSQPLCCSFSVISSHVENPSESASKTSDRDIETNEFEREKQESEFDAKAYQVFTEVSETGKILFVGVAEKMLSSFDCYVDKEEPKENGYTTDSSGSSDNINPPESDDCWDSDVATNEVPARYKLRARGSRRIGGLFPSEMISWLDEVDSDFSESDDVNAMTSSNNITVSTADVKISELPTVVVEIESLPNPTRVKQLCRSETSGGDVSDDDVNLESREEFSKVGSSGLKLVLKRNKVDVTSNGKSAKPFKLDKHSFRRSDKKMKMFDKEELMLPQDTVSVSKGLSFKESATHDSLSPPASDLEEPMQESIERHRVSALDTESGPLGLDYNESNQHMSSCVGDVSSPRNEDDDDDNCVLVLDESEKSPSDERSAENDTEPDGRVTGNVKSVTKRKYKKKILKFKAKQQLVVEEKQQTELRLAMEFPRHNWLVKHLIKEKRLENDEAATAEAHSPTAPTHKNTATKSRTPTPRSSPSPNEDSPHSEKTDTVKLKETPENEDVSIDVPEKQLAADSAKKADGSNHIAITPSTYKPSTTHANTEGTHVIGIVKPFHYPNQCETITTNTSICDDVECSKTRETDDPLELKSTLENDVLDCSTKDVLGVKIDKCFSLAPPLNQNSPLDLSVSVKKQSNEDHLALDLTRKAPVPFVIPQNKSPVTFACASTKTIFKNGEQLSSEYNTSKGEHTLKLDYFSPYIRIFNVLLSIRKSTDFSNTSPQSMTSYVMTQLRSDAVKLSKVVDEIGRRHLPPKEANVIDVDALFEDLPTVLPRTNSRTISTSFKPFNATSSATPTVGYRRRSNPGFVSIPTSSTAPRFSTISLDQTRVAPSHARVSQSNSAPPEPVLISGVSTNRASITKISRPHSNSFDNSRFQRMSITPQQSQPQIRQHSKPLPRTDHFYQPTVGHIVLGPPRPVLSSHMQQMSHMQNQIQHDQSQLQHPKNQQQQQLPFVRNQYGTNRPFQQQPRHQLPINHPDAVAELRNTSRDKDGFRVPIKPTPVHSGRYYAPAMVLNSPSGRYSVSQPTYTQSQVQQSVVQGIRPVIPRPPSIRAPTGGVSINSSPIHQQPRHNYNHQLKESYLSVRTPLAPSDAQRYSAHLKAQQNELHHKIESLKALEQKIQVAPALNVVKHTQASPATSQIYRTSPIMQTDFRKRKMNLPVSSPNPLSEKLRKMTPQGGANGNQVATEESCTVCKERAYFVCSGCHGVWYCSKYCQFQDWSSHSKRCI
ncbi:uncharacterized protein zf(mynd)-2 [Ciona intestinalis]